MEIRVFIRAPTFRLLITKAAIAVLFAAFKCKIVSEDGARSIVEKLAQWVARGVTVTSN